MRVSGGESKEFAVLLRAEVNARDRFVYYNLGQGYTMVPTTRDIRFQLSGFFSILTWEGSVFLILFDLAESKPIDGEL